MSNFTRFTQWQVALCISIQELYSSIEALKSQGWALYAVVSTRTVALMKSNDETDEKFYEADWFWVVGYSL
jgi:hypothetical protein